MKKYFTVFILLMITAGGCKKHNQEDNAPLPKEKKWVVTTVAGNGTAGFGNGAALSAKFDFPVDVAVDKDGDIYVTDADNHRIRKISGGQVSTFAGNDNSGYINGNGTTAQFVSPWAIASDANGNFYTSDIDGDHIRKISPTADVTTYTYTLAPNTPLWFNLGPEGGIVTDVTGNIYISDTYNQHIRKINKSGQATVIAGSERGGFQDGNGAAAKFYLPGGIAIDRQGNLYVADSYNFRIRKITPAGDVSTFAGNGAFGHADGDPGIAQFMFPVDIVTDRDDDLYVADNNRIRKITPSGIVSTIAGSTAGYKDGDGADAKFWGPYGIGIDAQGNIYVADTFNERIRKISFE